MRKPKKAEVAPSLASEVREAQQNRRAAIVLMLITFILGTCFAYDAIYNEVPEMLLPLILYLWLAGVLGIVAMDFALKKLILENRMFIETQSRLLEKGLTLVAKRIETLEGKKHEDTTET